MLPLRYPKAWSACAWLLVVAVVVGSLLPAPVIEPVVLVNDKVEHAVAYCLLMVWFAGLYERNRYWVIALELCVLGLALDLLQGLTATRSLDALDIAADIVGVAVGFALAYWLVGGWCLRAERRLLS